jgi:hypothetical protein
MSYNFFDEGKIYFSKKSKSPSGEGDCGTYSIYWIIYDLDQNKVGEIGYLYPEIFIPVEERRDLILNDILKKQLWDIQ